MDVFRSYLKNIYIMHSKSVLISLNTTHFNLKKTDLQLGARLLR